MREIKFDFNNIGGLAEIYAIPPSDFLRLRHDYNNDTDALELKSRDNIIVLPIYGDRSFCFTEQKSTDDGGDYWDVTIEGVIPKVCRDNAVLLEKLERGEWLVLSIDHNGTVHLSGSVDVPLMFSSERTTGDAYTALNGSAFTFAGRQPSPSVIIDIDDLTNI